MYMYVICIYDETYITQNKKNSVTVIWAKGTSASYLPA